MIDFYRKVARPDGDFTIAARGQDDAPVGFWLFHDEKIVDEKVRLMNQAFTSGALWAIENLQQNLYALSPEQLIALWENGGSLRS